VNPARKIEKIPLSSLFRVPRSFTRYVQANTLKVGDHHQRASNWILFWLRLDDLPRKQLFYLVGTVEDVSAKAEKLRR